MSLFVLIIILLIVVGVTAVIVYVETGQRRIPIQYARRVVGRRVYGGQSSHLPLKINTVGRHPADLRLVDPGFSGDVATFRAGG